MSTGWWSMRPGFAIPMRGNEYYSTDGGKAGFAIPMRGNEESIGTPLGGRLFAIPMRGNEGVELRDRWTVCNPHEG